MLRASRDSTKGSEGTPFSLPFSLLIGLISFSKFTIQYKNNKVECSVLPTTHSFFIFLNIPIAELFCRNTINRKNAFFSATDFQTSPNSRFLVGFTF
jgi:hypothetical protein